jgi:putative membrane protein
MLWIKAFHIITMVCWFAGIFYLPRIFVYLAMAEDAATRAHLQLMSEKLYRFTTPFAVLTILLGGWLMSFNLDYYLSALWFQIKLLLVTALVVYHVICGKMVTCHRQYGVQRSHVYYRWFNEAPVLVLFSVVILVIVRPFH